MTIRIVSAAALMLTLLVSTDRPLEGVAAQAPSGDRVILITLDGARTQEIFGGLDVAILQSTLREGQTLENDATYKRFWAPTPEQRRRKLMPFFWGTLMANHGSIAGNRALGSRVTLRNKHWFSYPGYSEILVGEPHDDVIKSNDPVRNPYLSVLEIMRERSTSRQRTWPCSRHGVCSTRSPSTCPERSPSTRVPTRPCRPIRQAAS